MQFSQYIDGFRQNDCTELLELLQLFKQNPLEKTLIFTIHQNYTLALIHDYLHTPNHHKFYQYLLTIYLNFIY